MAGRDRRGSLSSTSTSSSSGWRTPQHERFGWSPAWSRPLSEGGGGRGGGSSSSRARSLFRSIGVWFSSVSTSFSITSSSRSRNRKNKELAVPADEYAIKKPPDCTHTGGRRPSMRGLYGGSGYRNGSSSVARRPSFQSSVFSMDEILRATDNFSPALKIGQGGFGTVYKGIVPDTGALVAVKRCTHAGNESGTQARSEFLSELSIIAGLRHRNLLRLQGWCYEKGEILLVYDYMRNGSLDRALFDASSPAALPWHHRREILAGVASALAYLHHECERRVIHRDVKSSNVMLDDSFRARLGDFGLARQAEHGASPDATAAAGTMGYLAPEYMLTGRATEATDVFSFGALVLEVACGRRPIGGAPDRCNNLVEWVWGLHGEGRVLDAVDPRLAGEFDEGQVRRAMLVGLACSSPEPALRPGMRAVVQMLDGEADPPFVPLARPSMSLVSSANHQLLLSLQDSVSDYNALLGLNLTDSSSSDSMSSASLTSTLRRGGHDIGGSSSTGGEAR